MVLEWVAFSTNKNGLKLNLDNLDQFEHEVAIYFLSVCKMKYDACSSGHFFWFFLCAGAKQEEEIKAE